MNYAAYAAKAIYAGTVTFLGAVLAVMQSADTITNASWIAIALATVVAVGGVLGLQQAPSKISTSTRPF